MRRSKEIMREAAVLPLRAYQLLISPLLPTSCKYHPSCSQYAVDAVRQHGLAKGTVLAGWRLLRCNPWSHGGFDPVESQTLFARARTARACRSDSQRPKEFARHEEFGAA